MHTIPEIAGKSSLISHLLSLWSYPQRLRAPAFTDPPVCHRDRKKAKHEANEAIVKASAQLEDAEILKSEGNKLEAANQQMRETLRAREAEVARIR